MNVNKYGFALFILKLILLLEKFDLYFYIGI